MSDVPTPKSPAPSHVRVGLHVLEELARRALRLDKTTLARLGLSRELLDAAVHGAIYDDEGGRDAMRRAYEAIRAPAPHYTHALYFGPIDQPGHHLWGSSSGGRPLRVRRGGQDALLGRPSGMAGSDKAPLVPWGLKVDSGLLPRSWPEGWVNVLHKDGWTAFTYWDCTVDTRPKSCSTFLFNAVMSFEQALDAARREFPTVIDRGDFELELHTPTAQELGALGL